jgi:amino-acid N-acetyltransferase
MPASIEIRQADAESDLPAVAALLADAQLVALDSASQFGPQYAVAVTGDRVIGVAGIEVHDGNGLLRSVCLDPKYRSLRLGAALVENRIQWARKQGLGSLYLLTNTAANYWPRFGFVEIGRDSVPPGIAQTHEWSGACPASSTAMKLDLA